MVDRSGSAGVLARNSIANLLRVASTSLVALLMPVVLVTVLRPDLYAVWALLFGLAGFVLYLDFGLPQSVQTLVSRGIADGGEGRARARARSGIAWSAAIGGVMIAGLAVAGCLAKSLFPALSDADSSLLAWTVVLIGFGNIATFIGNTASAYFAGMQRSAVAAATLVPGRIASLVLAVPTAVITENLLLVAAAYAAPLVLGGVAMVARVLSLPAARPERSERTLVLRFSGPLAAWSVYMLCISGAGILIVGRVDFRAVAIFSLATAFAAALTGVQSALVSPVLSELGRAHAAGDRSRFTELVLTATRVNVAVVVVGVVGVEAIYLVASPYLGGAQDVPVVEGALILAGTVVAAGLRLTMSPLTFAFVASGAHRKLLLPPLFEALATLVATITLGVAFGGAGVSAGLLVGASAGVVIALLWSHRLTAAVDAPARRIAGAALARPAVALIPAQILFVALISTGGLGVTVVAVGAILMLVVTGVLGWTICVPASVRAAAAALLTRRVGRTNALVRS